MLKYSNDLYYQSQILAKYAGVVHGYSSRKLGDMRDGTNRCLFLTKLGISSHTLQMAQQVHDNVVEPVMKVYDRPVSLADGLVLGRKNGKSNIALGIVVADCVPILVADKKGKSIGVAHAGWKGSLKKIAIVLINQMNLLGSRTGDMLASIGPHIGMCCYTVPEDRAHRFLSEFGEDPRVATKTDGVWHVDIGYINRLQLQRVGIPVENIDAPATCTSCQIDAFYSYRKDSKETFGEIMAVMAYAA